MVEDAVEGVEEAEDGEVAGMGEVEDAEAVGVVAGAMEVATGVVTGAVEETLSIVRETTILGTMTGGTTPLTTSRFLPKTTCWTRIHATVLESTRMPSIDESTVISLDETFWPA